MARTSLIIYTVARAGVKPTYVAAIADGHSIANDGREILHVKNGDSAAKTVTIQTPGTVDSLAVAELTVAVPAGEERFIGPFPPNIYNQADRAVYVDYSAITSVTVAVLRI